MKKCPSLQELERVVECPTPGAAVCDHILHCTQCSDLARLIRENNAVSKCLVAVESQRLSSAWACAGRSDLEVRLSSDSAFGTRFLVDGPPERGGQGLVYSATDRTTGARVSVKVMARGNVATPRQRQQFEQEIRLTRVLVHPNIVRLFEAGITSTGLRYFVMEHIDGCPLDKYMRRRPDGSAGDRAPGSCVETIDLFARICDAIGFAHRRRIVHCDLKPANILVDVNGEPRVLDFGLARFLGAEALSRRINAIPAGDFAGTLAYAAPEQVIGASGHVDRRTDVYALGVILFQMLTGRHPYPGASSAAHMVKNILNVQPSSPSQVCPQVDRELDGIVLKAMAKAPMRRYACAEEMDRDVRQWLVRQSVAVGSRITLSTSLAGLYQGQRRFVRVDSSAPSA